MNSSCCSDQVPLRATLASFCISGTMKRIWDGSEDYGFELCVWGLAGRFPVLRADFPKHSQPSSIIQEDIRGSYNPHSGHCKKRPHKHVRTKNLMS